LAACDLWESWTLRRLWGPILLLPRNPFSMSYGLLAAVELRPLVREADYSSMWKGTPQLNQQTLGRLIGIRAAVTCRPLPHHRANGSVHGGSRGYASSSRSVKVVRANESVRSKLPQRELWSGPVPGATTRICSTLPFSPSLAAIALAFLLSLTSLRAAGVARGQSVMVIDIVCGRAYSRVRVRRGF
jgi:hypothetical protein